MGIALWPDVRQLLTGNLHPVETNPGKQGVAGHYPLGCDATDGVEHGGDIAVYHGFAYREPDFSIPDVIAVFGNAAEITVITGIPTAETA